jgi:hypothetical protein
MLEVPRSNPSHGGFFVDFPLGGWRGGTRRLGGWRGFICRKKSTKILNASIGHKLMCSVVVKVVLLDSLVSWFKLVFPPIFRFSNFSIFPRTSIFFPMIFLMIFYLLMIISNSFNLLSWGMSKCNVGWIMTKLAQRHSIWTSYRACISNIANLWRNLSIVMDAVWSVTKSMTKLAQRHSVWTSYRVSYPALPICDEIWLFVMDAVWSMTKLENVMWISS